MIRTLVAIAGALIVHGLFAVAVAALPRRPYGGSRLVEVDIRRKPPPPTPIAELPKPPPEPPKPPPKRVKRPKPPEVAKAPIPNETPKEPPREPPKPLFGVTIASTVGDSSFAVPVGNTTVSDPKNVARKGESVAPLPAAPPGVAPAPVFKPASPLEIKSEPSYDEASCTAQYPEGEAKQLGIEGETLLRVEIDDRGKVHGVRVLKGVGHGLDELAVQLLKTRCRFGPAIDTAGKPVAFVITHVFHWVLDR